MEYVYHILRDAILPDVSLADTIGKWKQIAEHLSSPPRIRRPQLEGMADLLS